MGGRRLLYVRKICVKLGVYKGAVSSKHGPGPREEGRERDADAESTEEGEDTIIQGGVRSSTGEKVAGHHTQTLSVTIHIQ